MSNLQLKTLTEKYFDKYKNWKPDFKFNQGVNTGNPSTKPETSTETEVPATNESSQDWHNHMVSLGYKKKVLEDGTHAYEDLNTGIYYYNNGRAYNPITKNRWGYKWQGLRNEATSNTTTIPSNSNYWRDPYLSGHRARNFSINGKKYAVKVNIKDDISYAYDPETNKYIQLEEDFIGIPTGVAEGAIWVSEGEIPSIALTNREAAWRAANPEPRKRGPLGGAITPEWNAWLKRYQTAQQAGWQKNGGIINKHQQGGTMNQDIQQQIVQLVQAAMQGNKEATQQINQIMAAAKQGDQKAMQLAKMIQAISQQMQGKSTKAELGAKLNYIQRLKGNCPEGEELVYFKSGGKVDCGCVKKQNGGAAPFKPNNKKKVIPMPKKYDGKKHERLALLNVDPKKKLTQAQTDSLNAYAKLYRELPDSIKVRDYNDQEVQAKACGGKAKKKK